MKIEFFGFFWPFNFYVALADLKMSWANFWTQKKKFLLETPH